MTPYISLVLILCICGSAAGFTLPPEPCVSGNGYQPFSSYCPHGYVKVRNCTFLGRFIVNLCYKLPPTTTSKPLPSTQPSTLQSTLQSILATTTPTTEPTTTVTTTQPTTTVTTTQPTTTVTTTQPTTTQPTTTVTTTQPTTTVTTTQPTTTVTTTQPTTTQPTTTVTTTQPTTTIPTTQPTTTVATTQTTTTAPTTPPQPRGCGRYPVQAFMMGSSLATQCQPWLGYAAFGKSYMSNALLIGEDTVLSIQPLYKRGMRLNYYFGKKQDASVTGGELEVDDEHDYDVDGTRFVVTKLKENVTVSGCVNPICIPEKKSDYSMENCFAATYVQDKDNTIHVEIGKTRLIDGPCTSPSNQPPPFTLCAYNFVQICNKDKENGGALICQSVKDKNSWMLAGVTRDTSDTSGCIPNAWNDPVYYWDTVELMKQLNISSNT